jgi:hypothetical protein
MGYSCTRDAQDTLAVLSTTYATDGNPNILTIGTLEKKQYFFERGDENDDGAITGTLMVMLPGGDFCRPAGSVRIEPDGMISRFPKLIATDRLKLERKAKELRATDPDRMPWRVPL